MAVFITKRLKGKAMYVIHLEYNPPVLSKKTGKPIYDETLNFTLYRNPTSPRMKLFNQDNLERAEAVKKYREKQIADKEITLCPEVNSTTDLVGFFKEIAKRTDVNYNSVFLKFSEFCKGCCPFSSVDAAFVNNFRNYLISLTEPEAESPMSLCTAGQYLNQTRFVLREAYNQGYLPEDLHDCVDIIRVDPDFDNLITKEEIEKLMKVECPQEQIPRMCYFIALTGVRTKFVLELKWEDVFAVPGKRPFIVKKKQRTERNAVMYISEEALHYLGKRKKSGPVFENNCRLLRDLHRWEKAAGVRDWLGFEQFRIRISTLKKTRPLLK